MYILGGGGGPWIYSEGPIIWPSHSPALNSCDISLWGCIKENVYTGEVDDCDFLISYFIVAVTDKGLT
jgi:hypothetical protein